MQKVDADWKSNAAPIHVARPRGLMAAGTWACCAIRRRPVVTLTKQRHDPAEPRPWRWTCAVAAYALGVSRAAMDFAWARLGEIGVVLDYNATIMQCSAAVDRMFALKAEWEAT